MLSKIPIYPVACAVVSLLTSCAIVDTGHYLAPGAQLESGGQYYIVMSANDDHSLHQIVADAMSRAGLRTKRGGEKGWGAESDYLVRYGAQWQWDLTWYLLYFELRVYDPEAKQLLASASSLRMSLARKSAEDVVSEVLGQLFSNAKAP